MDVFSGYVAATIIIMVLAGCMGAYCRHILDKETAPPNVFRILLPGIVASFLIPLFLNIGHSKLLSNVLEGGKEFAQNAFVLFAFCLLAAASARSFVDALGRQALQKATEAERKAESATANAGEATKVAESAKEEAYEAKDLLAETLERPAAGEPSASQTAPISEGASSSEAEATANSRDNREGLRNLDLSDSERAVFNAFLDSRYSRRSLSGVVRDSQLPKPEARRALLLLMERGLVTSRPSRDSPGTTLYELNFDAVAGLTGS